MAKLPVFSSKSFRWRDGRGTSSSSTLGLREMPRSGFYIKSARTGALALFLYDHADMEANEFYDGEAVSYMSPGQGATVSIRVSQ